MGRAKEGEREGGKLKIQMSRCVVGVQRIALRRRARRLGGASGAGAERISVANLMCTGNLDPFFGPFALAFRQYRLQAARPWGQMHMTLAAAKGTPTC